MARGRRRVALYYQRHGATVEENDGHEHYIRTICTVHDILKATGDRAIPNSDITIPTLASPNFSDLLEQSTDQELTATVEEAPAYLKGADEERLFVHSNPIDQSIKFGKELELCDHYF